MSIYTIITLKEKREKTHKGIGKMNFEATSNNIKGVFTATRRYRIPRFQRDFSWEQSNYNEFLTDMLSQITFNTETNKFENSQYFLGNMLFLGRKESDLVEVIDGQQRITTITILLAALRDTLYKLSEIESNEEEYRKLAKSYADTIQDEYLIKRIDGEPQRKVETTSSFPYFTQTIQDYQTRNKNVEPSTEEEQLLKQTFEFFLKKLEEKNFLKIFSERDECKNFDKFYYLEALKALREQVLKSQVIEVFVAEKEQANRIFENINSKGKPLTPVDLIKNSIFSRLDITSAGVDETSLIWSEFNQKLINLDTSFNEFFLHYWKAIYPEDSANGSNLYKKFSKRFNAQAENDTEILSDFVSNLNKGFNFYTMIVNPDYNEFKRQSQKPELEYLTSINYFKGVQVRPALLSLYMKNEILGDNKKLPTKEKNEFLQFLSNFHFAAFGTTLKIRSNTVTTPYKEFSTKVTKSENKGDIRKAISKLKSDLIELIPKEKFLQAFIELEFSKNKSKNKLESFPASYAIKQLSNKLETRDFSDDEYSIEHILDESLGENTNIGNLVVLETKFNEEANQIKQKKGVITFKEKREIYLQSNYKMVALLLESYEVFSRDNILERAKALSNQFWEIYFTVEN